MASQEQNVPSLRDFLAAERTFLAWVRTGLALMAFGFVVARFGLFLKQIAQLQPSSMTSHQSVSLWFGISLIVFAVVMNSYSAWRHVRLIKRWRKLAGDELASGTQVVVLAVFLGIVGLAMAVYLFSIPIGARSAI